MPDPADYFVDRGKVYRVTASEPLFNEWRELCVQIGNLSSLVQNDGVEVSLGELMEWNRLYLSKIEELNKLKLRIFQHVIAGGVQ